MGTDFDLLYGSIGRDFTGMFKSFTFDFKAMRFRLLKSHVAARKCGDKNGCLSTTSSLDLCYSFQSSAL